MKKTGSGRKGAIPLLAVALTVFIVDQILKSYIRSAEKGAVLFDSRMLRVLRRENRGMAYGLLSAYPGVVVVLQLLLCAVLIAVIVSHLRQNEVSYHRSIAENTSMALILGGAAGNLTDRLRFGGVTDFLNVPALPFGVFNFADVCICAGCLLLAFVTVIGRHETDGGRGTD